MTEEVLSDLPGATVNIDEHASTVVSSLWVVDKSGIKRPVAPDQQGYLKIIKGGLEE